MLRQRAAIQQLSVTLTLVARRACSEPASIFSSATTAPLTTICSRWNGDTDWAVGAHFDQAAAGGQAQRFAHTMPVHLHINHGAVVVNVRPARTALAHEAKLNSSPPTRA